MTKRLLSLVLCVIFIISSSIGCGKKPTVGGDPLTGSDLLNGSNSMTESDSSNGNNLPNGEVSSDGSDLSISSGLSSGSDSSTDAVDTRPIQTIKFIPLTAGSARDLFPNSVGDVAGRSNDILLYGNPDRGYRTTLPLVIYAKHKVNGVVTDTCDLIYESNGKYYINTSSVCNGKHSVEVAFANLKPEYKELQLDYMINNVYFLSTQKTDYKPKLQLLQLSLPDCRDAAGKKPSHLPENVLETIQIIFDKMREREVRILFRVGYHMVQYNLTLNQFADKRAEAYVSEAQMLMHIEDLAKFFARQTENGQNIEVINKISSGFIGSGGEMASAYQWPTFTSANYNNVIKKVVESICVPFGLYYTTRTQKYKKDFVTAYPQYAHIVGTNNDAVFGESTEYGQCGGCYQYNHNFIVTGSGQCREHDLGGTHITNTWWDQVAAQAAYTPQSGEMYHGLHKTYKDKDSLIPTGLEVIKEMVHHRFVTLSQWNSYETVGSYTDEEGIYHIGDSVFQRWINNETVTPKLLDAEGIIYDPSWFYDDNGNLVHRNPYEFLRDHLGYKVVAQKATISGAIDKKSKVNVDLKLKNYGFAAAFNIESGYMILDKDYNVVSTVKAGEPEKWYSHDPENWKSTEVLEHTVTANITLPSKSGKYYLAFYMRNTMEDYAKLSNEMAYKSDKYNILYEFEI